MKQRPNRCCRHLLGICLACLVLLLTTATPLLAQVTSEPDKPVKFVVPTVDVHEIEAKAVDQTYRIQVSVPAHQPGSDQTFGVLYLTDTSAPMGGLADLIHMIAFAGEMPPVIVVGVGYPVDSITQTLAVRTRDLTPVSHPLLASQGIYKDWIEGTLEPSSKATGGGAAEFLEFFHEELFPFIQNKYPASDDRTYFGDSLGGLFGTYILLERPETFSRYIIGSPSLWVGDEWMMKRAEEIVAKRDDLEARVFIGVGGSEELAELANFRMVTNVGRLHRLLLSGDFPSMKLTSHVFPDETHQTVITMNLMRGLRAVYDPTSNELIDAVMKAMGMESGGN